MGTTPLLYSFLNIIGAKRLGGETTRGAKRLGGKRPGGKRLGSETTRGGNGLGAKRPGFNYGAYRNSKKSDFAVTLLSFK